MLKPGDFTQNPHRGTVLSVIGIFHQLRTNAPKFRFAGHPPANGESKPLRSEIICNVSEPPAQEVLRQARQLVKSQQYAAALDKYIWFHDHALDADRSLAGVRLSYAISEWVDLGEVYPPARRALESVRNAKAESLIQGTYDASLFHDVASINRVLGQVERTRDLFKTIAGADRGVAEKCFHVALESLVQTK